MSDNRKETRTTGREAMVELMLASVERGDKKTAKVLKRAAERDPKVAEELDRRGLTFSTAESRKEKKEREARGLWFTSPSEPTPAQANLASSVREPAPLPLVGPDPADGGPDVRSISARMPYGPGAQYSMFRDMVYDTEDRRSVSAAIDAGRRPVSGLDFDFIRYGDGSVEEARNRLAVAREIEKRDVTAAGGGAGFVVNHYFGNAVSTAARATTKAFDVTTQRPMPESGMTIDVPVISTGVSAAVYDEGDTISETNIVTTKTASPVVTIAAMVDVSWQLLERSAGLVDQSLATDATRALGATLDVQLLTGSGSNGELTGLLNQSGITETTYNDASPTVAEWRAKMWTLQRDVIAASGREPDTLIWGPTRSAWAWSGTDTVERQMVGLDLPAAQTIMAAVPSTLGTGTNEDRALMLARDEVYLYASPVTFQVFTDVLSSTGTVRLMARMYAALALRTPSAVGVLKGTGCVVPTI